MRNILNKSSLAAAALLGFVSSAHAVPIGSAYVGGLIQADYVNFAGDKRDVAKSSGDLRRVRAYIKGDLGDDWSYQVTLSDGGVSKTIGGDTTWIGYDGFDVAWIAFGLINVPQSLEFWSGYTYQTFMEYASPVQAMYLPRGLGVYADAEAAGGLFSYQLAAYVPEPVVSGNTDEIIDGVRYSTTGTDSDEWGFAGRGVVKPDIGLGDVLHLGASVHYEGIGTSQNVNQMVTTPGMLGRDSGTRDNVLVSSLNPNAGDMKGSTTYGLEAALLWGPFTAQAEYLKTHWDGRASNSDLGFHGYYGQVSYVLTGEPRYYDSYSAVIGPVEYITNAYGAWELGFRYAYTDLSDSATTGYTASNDNKTGKQKDYTFGINWYVTDNVRFQANYVYAKADYRNSTGRSDKNVKSMGVRGQIAF